MKNIFFILLVFLTITSYAQLRSNNSISSTIADQSAFLDASANTFSNSVNNGKGLAFPRTNLTTFTFNPTTGNFLGYPTGFDGFIVYNTTTGTTPASGSGVGSQNVEPGFYYFSNPGNNFGNPNAGQWIPFASGGGGGTVITTNTINTSVTEINGVAENVVILPATANGSTTELVLNTTGLTNGPLSVSKLREAKIYLGTRLMMIASGDYDNGTNTLVTGDGIINKLLRNEGADAYTVELYYEP